MSKRTLFITSNNKAILVLKPEYNSRVVPFTPLWKGARESTLQSCLSLPNNAFTRLACYKVGSIVQWSCWSADIQHRAVLAAHCLGHVSWAWQGAGCSTDILMFPCPRVCPLVTRCRFSQSKIKGKSAKEARWEPLSGTPGPWPSILGLGLHRMLLRGPLCWDPQSSLLPSNHLLPLTQIIPVEKRNSCMRSLKRVSRLSWKLSQWPWSQWLSRVASCDTDVMLIVTRQALQLSLGKEPQSDWAEISSHCWLMYAKTKAIPRPGVLFLNQLSRCFG